MKILIDKTLLENRIAELEKEIEDMPKSQSPFHLITALEELKEILQQSQDISEQEESKTMFSLEDMKKAWNNGNNYHRGSLIQASQFTFDKTIESLTKQGSFDEEGYAITRGFESLKQEESSNWDEIYLKWNEYLNSIPKEDWKDKWKNGIPVWNWLKEHYLPPVKR